jgi:hypothetical protein
MALLKGGPTCVSSNRATIAIWRVMMKAFATITAESITADANDAHAPPREAFREPIFPGVEVGI